MRTLVLWCPDWAVTAAELVEGIDATGPVAVLRANRVVACSVAARTEGVRHGLRRREAQGRCPQLIVIEDDPGRDARAFEPVVVAVEEMAAGVEVVRPGLLAVAARGPGRYFGGEERAAERIVEHVAQSCSVESQVGIAEGTFAAGLAAREGRIVGSGRTAEFLAGMTVDALERPELADLLRRLGMVTLGDFAALPESGVLSRFGFDGALAHRLASGSDHRPLAVRKPPPDLEVSETYDEPLERVDVAAFAGRVLAERLHDRLAGQGLACTRLGIEAVTANGQELHRVWRHDGLLTAAAIAERVRWQLDGWLTDIKIGKRVRKPAAGLLKLRLIPEGVIVHLGLQPGLWGDAGDERERAHRAFSRVQGLLGPDAVLTAVLGGGRSADDQVTLVPWGDERAPARPAAPAVGVLPGWRSLPVAAEGENDKSRGGWEVEGAKMLKNPAWREGKAVGEGERGIEEGEGNGRAARGARGVGSGAGVSSGVGAGSGGKAGGRRRGSVGKREGEPPWPGRIPSPAPALVLPRAEPVGVLDGGGVAVSVSARLELSGRPAVMVIDGEEFGIEGWAGPWPVDERWWAPEEARRRARFQMVLEDGRAFLLGLAGGRWAVEAIYD